MPNTETWNESGFPGTRGCLGIFAVMLAVTERTTCVLLRNLSPYTICVYLGLGAAPVYSFLEMTQHLWKQRYRSMLENAWRAFKMTPFLARPPITVCPRQRPARKHLPMVSWPARHQSNCKTSRYIAHRCVPARCECSRVPEGLS